MKQVYPIRDKVYYSFVECVGENLNIIDAQFLGYLSKKVASEKQNSDLPPIEWTVS
jgi:hypothetical protein